jgi:type IV secretory pathway VirB4 component
VGGRSIPIAPTFRSCSASIAVNCGTHIWKREYLAVLESTHGTPYYYLNLPSGDVAHVLLLGATGSGKSFCLSFTLQRQMKM